MQFNVKIKIALSRDRVGILINISVGNQWAIEFRGGKINIFIKKIVKMCENEKSEVSEIVNF